MLGISIPEWEQPLAILFGGLFLDGMIFIGIRRWRYLRDENRAAEKHAPPANEDAPKAPPADRAPAANPPQWW